MRCLAVWLFGCLAVGLLGCRVVGLPDCRSSGCRGAGVPGCRVIGLSGYRVVGLSGRRVVGRVVGLRDALMDGARPSGGSLAPRQLCLVAIRDSRITAALRTSNPL